MNAHTRAVLRDRRAQLLVAVLALLLAAAAFWLGPARAAIVGVQGGENLTITQDGATSTIFRLEVLAPGEQASGVVTLGNDGALGGALRLALRDLRDETGLGGVPFSEVLEIRVADVTDPAAEAELWRGTLASLGQIELGRLAPTTPRSFRVTVRWPDTGAPPSRTTGDNAYSGAKSQFVLAWGLLEDAAPNPPGGGGGTAGSGSSLSAVASRSAVVVKPTASRTCVSRRRFTIRVRATKALRPTSATIAIGGKRVKVLSGKRLRATIDLRGRKKQTVVVRIKGRTKSGRPYRETRTYRTCVPKKKSKRTAAATSVTRTIG